MSAIQVGSILRSWSEGGLFLVAKRIRTEDGSIMFELDTVAEKPAFHSNGNPRTVFEFEIGDDEGKHSYQLYPPPEYR